MLVGPYSTKWRFPSGAVVKNPPANAGNARDADSISGSGRPSGEGNGNLLQYSCLGNPMDRGAWWAIVQEVTRESGYDSVTKQQVVKETEMEIEIARTV